MYVWGFRCMWRPVITSPWRPFTFVWDRTSQWPGTHWLAGRWTPCIILYPPPSAGVASMHHLAFCRGPGDWPQVPISPVCFWCCVCEQECAVFVCVLFTLSGVCVDKRFLYCPSDTLEWGCSDVWTCGTTRLSFSLHHFTFFFWGVAFWDRVLLCSHGYPRLAL